MNNLKLIDWEVRAFRALTRLYPPEFRTAYGSEVVAFFLQERSQKVRGPSLLRAARWWLFWMGTVLDLVVTGIRLRRREQTERGGWMGGWIGDLRHTIRVLVREPTFTLVALITVVLGVGSTAAIFSVVDGVVLRPLAYHDSERLVLVGALFGLYGTVSYSVQRRTRELGIRIALGASENALVGSVVREGFMDAMLGIVLGVAASLLTTRFVAAYLFRVEPTDVTTFAVTATLLLAASLVAAWIPARGVARVDPYLSLNSEA